VKLLIYIEHLLRQLGQAQGRSDLVIDMEGVGKDIEVVPVLALLRGLTCLKLT